MVAGGAGIGYARSQELAQREKNLELLLQLLLLLKGEIRWTNSTLPDAFRGISSKISEPFQSILGEAAEAMEQADGRTLAEILQFCGEKSFCGKSRNEREVTEILRILGSRLGYLDREMQLRQIEFLETDLQLRRRQVREKLPEQKKICRILGILGGILLAVLFL